MRNKVGGGEDIPGIPIVDWSLWGDFWGFVWIHVRKQTNKRSTWLALPSSEISSSISWSLDSMCTDDNEHELNDIGFGIWILDTEQIKGWFCWSTSIICSHLVLTGVEEGWLFPCEAFWSCGIGEKFEENDSLFLLLTAPISVLACVILFSISHKVSVKD